MKKIHLKPIEEVYPDLKGDYFYGPSDYRPMVESMGTVLLEVTERDYQGYSRFLLKDNDRYGYLMFGWGSCSGCDALQACNSYEEIHKLRKELYRNIVWKSRDEMLKYMQDHDWQGDAAGNTEECREFVQKSIRQLFLDQSEEIIKNINELTEMINNDREFNKEIDRLIQEDNELTRQLAKKGD